MPALPEDRVRRLNQLNCYFTILPKKTVGAIFTRLGGRRSLCYEEKPNRILHGFACIGSIRIGKLYEMQFHCEKRNFLMQNFILTHFWIIEEAVQLF